MKGRERIARNLRRIRTDQGLSQESLAVDADVDRSYISGIENAGFNATIDILDRLAAALGVDVAEFLMKPKAGSAAPKPLSPGRKRT